MQRKSASDTIEGVKTKLLDMIGTYQDEFGLTEDQVEKVKATIGKSGPPVEKEDSTALKVLKNMRDAVKEVGYSDDPEGLIYAFSILGEGLAVLLEDTPTPIAVIKQYRSVFFKLMTVSEKKWDADVFKTRLRQTLDAIEVFIS